MTARVAEREETEGGLSGSGAVATVRESSPSDLGGNRPVNDASAPRTLLSRRTLSMVLILVDVAVLALTVAHVHGPVRLVLGLVLGAFIPGWSVVGPFRLGHLALEVSLAVAMSFVLLMLAAQILMTVHEWHLLGLEEATCALCFPSLIWQSRPGRS
jgi:hypothetical protein